jgi:hypothetical protein
MRRDLRSHYAGAEDSGFAHHEFTIIQCRLQFDPFFSSGKSPLRKQSGILARLPFTHHVKVSYYGRPARTISLRKSRRQ